MTIFHGNSTKRFTLYPPTRAFLDSENPLWFEDSDEEYAQPCMTLDLTPTFKEHIVEDVIVPY